MNDLIDRIYAEVKPYTVVPREGVELTIRLTIETIKAGVPGVLVECGTWKGGCSYAMLLAQRYALGGIQQPVWMFDSYQGLPPPGPRDGPYAHQWQGNALANGPGDHKNNCTAAVEEALAARQALGFNETEAIITKGWFHETLPVAKKRGLERVAVLRVDADWYDSCRVVYNELGPLVAPKGAVIIDDYTVWAGCARATHEFLVMHNHCWRIKGGADLYCAWMVADDKD